MFIQKFYKVIKSFQFHFARGIVYGEESSKSHQITKISKNVRSRDQFKKYETETRLLRDQDRDHQQKSEIETETETLKIGLETGLETKTGLETFITGRK